MFWFRPLFNYFYFFIVSILIVCQMYNTIIEKNNELSPICQQRFRVDQGVGRKLCDNLKTELLFLWIDMIKQPYMILS